MAMTACRECGKPVSTQAKNCPHCGTSAPSKKKGKGGIGKWLLIFFAIGLVATVMPKKEDRVAGSNPAPRATAAQAEKKSEEAKAAALEAKRKEEEEKALDAKKDQCFLRGETLATVYLANFSQVASTGLMPSDVMREGCERMAQEQGIGDACIRSCEHGFKREARAALK
jgi:hypothetical protein